MVLPWSTNLFSTSSNFRVSSKWRPVVGSSRMYSVRPVPRLDSSLASFTRFATRERRGRLTELDVPQPHVLERPKFIGNAWKIFEKRQCLVDREIENIGN